MVDLSSIEGIDVDRYLEDRQAGKPWQPLEAYMPPSPLKTEPLECPSCMMISRFYVDDYICCACRDRK